MRLAPALVAVLLGGCTLVDQRTFNPDAQRRPSFAAPASPAAVAPEPGPRPLLTARAPVDTQAVQADIARAVAAARRLKPGVVFDVVEVTPDTGGSLGADAAAIARLIAAQGIPASRIHLAARPATALREVRVYVR